MAEGYGGVDKKGGGTSASSGSKSTGGGGAAASPGAGLSAGKATSSVASAAKSSLDGISKSVGAGLSAAPPASKPAPAKTATLGSVPRAPTGLTTGAAAAEFAGKKMSNPSVSASPAELDKAAKVAVAESAAIKNSLGNMNLDQTAAVAEVMKNRTMSSGYPPTLGGVINQPGQFSPVADGSLAKVDPNSQNYKEALDTVKSVFDGTMPSQFAAGTNPTNYGNLGTIMGKPGYSSAATKQAFSNMDAVKSYSDFKNPSTFSHSFGTLGNVPASQKTTTPPMGGMAEIKSAYNPGVSPLDPSYSPPPPPDVMNKQFLDRVPPSVELGTPPSKTITDKVPATQEADPWGTIGGIPVPGGIKDAYESAKKQAADAITSAPDQLKQIGRLAALGFGDGLPHKSMVGESRGRPELGTQTQKQTQTDPMMDLWYQLLLGSWV